MIINAMINSILFLNNLRDLFLKVFEGIINDNKILSEEIAIYIDAQQIGGLDFHLSNRIY